MIPRKRKQRAVLSCNDCRRRKLSCNRELPCSRCIRGEIAESCSYRNDVIEDKQDENRVREPSQAFSNQSTVVTDQADGPGRQHLEPSEPTIASAHTTSDSLAEPRTQQLERRIATLEAALQALKQELKESPQPDPVENATFTISSGFFKGRSYRTFYYGPTNPMFVASHFPDLRPFMNRIYIDSTLSRLRQDMRGSEKRLRAAQSTGSRVFFIPNLRSTLPDRTIVDKLVRTYFDTFERTYRILHAPTFWEDYGTYWDTPPSHTAPYSEIDAIILGILACTLCTSTHETTRYDANGSTFRSKAIFWSRVCEAWLGHQSQKHRSLASLQVQLLRILALSTTSSKTKMYYVEVQNLVTHMRSIGMHRDPEILGRARCSVFEGEMRRRLWATAVELELQASTDKGVPSVLSGTTYDCNPPRNINDSEMFPSMEHLPSSHPRTAYTSTSYLFHASQSLPLRIRMCTQNNNIQLHNPPAAEKQKDESELQKAISLLPQWTEPHALQVSTLLDLQLRQWLLHLYKGEVLQLATAKGGHLYRNRPSTRYALVTTLEAASSCISSHMGLVDSDNFALCLTRSDYLTAAFLICHITYYASVSKDMMISRLAHSLFATSTDAALKLLEERCMRPGRGNHKYWFLSAACSLAGMQWEKEEERKRAAERLACERVCKLLYKELAAKEDEDVDYDGKELRMGAKGVNEIILFSSTTVTTVTTTTPSSSAPLTSMVIPVPRQQEPLENPSAFPHQHSPSAFVPFHNGSDAEEAWMLNDMWFMDDLGDGYVGGGGGFGFM